ncbi:DUF1707 SHOCT-like domain-containing protein [Nocardioides limicola]|uniref:DUF1707 SHOCT-like domain-containing protein n=1 Tax=Nocardioides limicola TaxID=2803368 RepID=UPI00193BED3E|nr:DUF1707 domain-containing protein [Nocardioides sp. DJM-14]
MSGSDHLRIGDEERRQAIEVLGEHFAAGRLDREEYDERCRSVWNARTNAAIRPLFADLPGARAGVPVRAPMANLPLRPRQPRTRLPFIPVLLLLIAAVLITGHGWLIPLGLALWLLLKRPVPRTQASGNRRPIAGS